MSNLPTRPLSDTVFLTEFRDFARSLGDEEYPWSDASNCALAQFGYPDVQDDDLRGVPESAFTAAIGFPTNFRDLADRLDALLIDSPVVGRVG